MKDVSESIKNVKVDRGAFGAAITKLLTTPPTSKAAISRKIKFADRRQPLRKPLRDPQ